MAIDAACQFCDEDWNAWAENGFLISLTSSSVLLGWGKPERRSDPGKADIALFAPDFYLEDPKPWFIFPNVATVPTSILLEIAQKRIVATENKWTWSDPDFQDYESQFDKVLASIHKNEIHKAVPVMFVTGSSQPVRKDFPRLISSLLTRAGKRTPYGLWSKQGGMLGASPEVLFHIRGDDAVLETMALAGTRLTDYELKSSLINDPKEMYEHELVVRGLREKLKPKGDIRVTPTYIWDIGKICHLRTDVEVELNEPKLSYESFSDLIQSLHPTAALGLSPVNLPVQHMKKFEGKIPHGGFGAPFGIWERSGRARVMVAIRNLIWDEKQARIGTGSGLVAASQLENEWREHQVKRQTILDLFGI